MAPVGQTCCKAVSPHARVMLQVSLAKYLQARKIRAGQARSKLEASVSGSNSPNPHSGRMRLARSRARRTGACLGSHRLRQPATRRDAGGLQTERAQENSISPQTMTLIAALLGGPALCSCALAGPRLRGCPIGSAMAAGVTAAGQAQAPSRAQFRCHYFKQQVRPQLAAIFVLGLDRGAVRARPEPRRQLSPPDVRTGARAHPWLLQVRPSRKQAGDVWILAGDVLH